MKGDGAVGVIYFIEVLVVLGDYMSTMNSEIYAALIDAGSSEEKARAAAVSVTDYERDMHEV